MRQCEICKKGYVLARKRRKLRGKYNPTPKSKRYPNLQWARAGSVRKLICAQCLKTLHKTTRRR